MKKILFVVGCIMLTAISTLAEEKCNDPVLSKDNHGIITEAKKALQEYKSAVKVSGNAKITPGTITEKCGIQGVTDVHLIFKMPKTTTLTKAASAFSNANLNNEMQKRYEDYRDPWVKDVAATKVAAPKDSTSSYQYSLEQYSNVKFLFFSFGAKNIRNKCNESFSPKTATKGKTWTRSCRVDTSSNGKDSLSVFQPADEKLKIAQNTMINECEETDSGVVCTFTQHATMRPQCKAGMTGLETALIGVERMVSIQTALAEHAALETTKSTPDNAFEAFKDNTVDSKILEFQQDNEGKVINKNRGASITF